MALTLRREKAKRKTPKKRSREFGFCCREQQQQKNKRLPEAEQGIRLSRWHVNNKKQKTPRSGAGNLAFTLAREQRKTEQRKKTKKEDSSNGAGKFGFHVGT